MRVGRSGAEDFDRLGCRASLARDGAELGLAVSVLQMTNGCDGDLKYLRCRSGWPGTKAGASPLRVDPEAEGEVRWPPKVLWGAMVEVCVAAPLLP